MSRSFLRASLKLWTRRLEYRRGRLRHWTAKHNADRIAKWRRLVDLAEQRVSLRRRQLARPTPAKGIDVSNNNGRVDFAKVHAAGYRFVFCKASEGTTFSDSFLIDNVRRARAAGLKVGAYHFLNAAPASAQASLFIARMRAAGLGAGDLLPVVDVEKQGVTTGMASAFVDAIHRELGVKPLIYTFPAFARWPSTFGCGLWIAHFGVRKPTIPGPWSRYTAWQHSSTASVPGVSGNCDVNVTSDMRELVW